MDQDSKSKKLALERESQSLVDDFASIDQWSSQNAAEPSQEAPVTAGELYEIPSTNPEDAQSAHNNLDHDLLELSLDFAAPPGELQLPDEHSESLQIEIPEETVELTPPQKPETTESVQEFAAHAPLGNPQVQVNFPFSLLIDGNLLPEEREKLVDLLNREKIDIREIDLEPQFQAGKILLPRINEYIGVILIQALRGARVRFRLGPSDEIYSTADTQGDDLGHPLSKTGTHDSSTDSNEHPAQEILVTHLPALPELPFYVHVAYVTASAALKSRAVEAENSREYQDLLDSLQREIRYKAFHQGATAVINFTIQLTPLAHPNQYRLTASGAAVRPKP